MGVERAVKYVQPIRVSNPSNFYNEPQVLRTLEHKNIVRVEDAGRLPDGQLYIAMEYLKRGSLHDVAKGAIFPLRNALQIIRDVCRGVEYAHGKGFIHRDIKPANILIGDDGSGKLSDFGLATKLSKTGIASPYGYFLHLAPEVLLSDETSVRSDIYALGVTLYRLVNGDAALPQVKDDLDLERKIVKGEYPDRQKYRPFIPDKLRKIINRAMDPDPNKRYETAQMLRRSLEQTPISCDWSFQITSNGTIWRTNVDGMEFEAKVERNKDDSFSFVVTKGSSGCVKRLIAKDCCYNLASDKIRKRIHNVLSRITLKGR